MAAEALLEHLLQGQPALWRSPEGPGAARGGASGLREKGGQEPRWFRRLSPVPRELGAHGGWSR